MSPKTDSYSYGVVLLELVVGLPHTRVHEMLFDDPDFFSNIRKHADAAAGEWPKKTTKGLADVAELCLQFRAISRGTVRDLLPKVAALAVVSS